MKALPLMALSLSLCLPLVGCIAPFRVKARADVAVNMITPETPGAPIRPLMSERHAP